MFTIRHCKHIQHLMEGVNSPLILPSTNTHTHINTHRPTGTHKTRTGQHTYAQLQLKVPQTESFSEDNKLPCLKRYTKNKHASLTNKFLWVRKWQIFFLRQKGINRAWRRSIYEEEHGLHNVLWHLFQGIAFVDR